MQLINQTKIEELNALKIFAIPDNSGQRMAYFMIRSWGNYLFFPHPDISNMFPFIKGQGGIYKVFDAAVPFPFTNGQLFTIFGASTLGPSLKYHEDFLIEEYGTDYFDPDLNLRDGVFEIIVKERVVRFLDMNISSEIFQDGEYSRLASIESA